MRTRTAIAAAATAASLTALVSVVPGALAERDSGPNHQAAPQRVHRENNDNGGAHKRQRRTVGLDIFAPGRRDNAGVGGKGWFVDLAVRYPGTSLATAGIDPANPLQLTGPGVHANAAPFPGSFSPGRDDHLPGLVVLASTTKDDRPTLGATTAFQGAGTNLANLFNVTGVTDRTAKDFEIWDTWIVGAPIAGQNVDTVLTVAVMAPGANGVYNTAPAYIRDVNGDGKIDGQDLKMLGVASAIEQIPFHINGAPGS